MKKTPFGKGGELQLTDALMTLRKEEAVYGKDIEGIRHDTGNKLGYIKAIIDFALEREDTKDFMKELIISKAKEFSKE